MKIRAVLSLLTSLCCLAIAANAAATEIRQVPSYNQNGLLSTRYSSLAGSACGPTAAANMLAYWDQKAGGYPRLWTPDRDIAPFPADDTCVLASRNVGYPLIAHLYREMGTLIASGTSPYGWIAGLNKHVNNTAGTCSTGRSYSATLGLYQKAATYRYAPQLSVNSVSVTVDTMWNTVRTEIDSHRPVALYIDLLDGFGSANLTTARTEISPANYAAGILTDEDDALYQLYLYYSYHWVTVYGYEGSAVGERILLIKSGFGMNHRIRFDSYFDNADNLAIATLDIHAR